MIFDMTKRNGGGTPERVFDENADICFWDYDGTPLYSYSFAEVQSMTSLPEPPDHSNDEIPLSFQKWNWELAELQAIDYPMDVGAIYYPTDNKLHFFYCLRGTTGLTTSFETTQSSRFTVDWGDGTIEEWGSSTGNGANPTHTYATYGIYHVKISGICIPITQLCKETNQALVKGLYLCADNNGSWLGSYWNFAANSSGIEVVTGFTGVSSMGTNQSQEAIRNTPYLKAYVFGKNSAVHPLSGCYSLKMVSYPSVLNFSTTADMLVNARSLKRIRIAPTISTYRANFSNVPIEFYKGKLALKTCVNDDCLRRLVIIGNIESSALGSACPLEEIWCGLTTPPTLGSTTPFSGIRKNAKIHVPAEALADYQAASNWSTYAEYMVGDWTAATEPDR